MLFRSERQLLGHRRADTVKAQMVETVLAIGNLIGAGKIRHWGLSNENASGVTLACETALQCGVPLPAAITNDYSLTDRHFDLGVSEVCHLYGIRLLPYGVLAGGFLTGKYLGGSAPEARHTDWPTFQPRYAQPAVREALLKSYKQISERLGITLTTLAIAWAASRWHTDAIVTGQSSVTQMMEQAHAVSYKLDKAVLREIDQVHVQNRCPQWVD
eukprot:TRINITY_DN38672_c0_g1_i1.p2 TRINITY_DN38672_c0_g1~~TRINITY_DN38672_c0_g1_i1.p2  ORF type:complete len:215 (+),score=6.32 TRINITY_DN38672_c0_g1_i1:312-956(+)